MKATLVIVLILACAALCGAEDRQRELDDLLKILPATNTRITGRISAQDKSWEDWVRRTGELPPDFDRMPSVPGLPEPQLTTRHAWLAERQRIRGLFEQWIYGKMPPPLLSRLLIRNGSTSSGTRWVAKSACSPRHLWSASRRWP